MLSNKKNLSLEKAKYLPIKIPMVNISPEDAIYSVEISQKEEKFKKSKIVDEEKSLLEGISFNLNNFIRPKEIGINEETKRILRMPPEKRNNNHIKTVCTSLIEAVPEFMEFTPRIQKSIAKLAMLQDFETGRLIIRQNHRALNYYFIVSGVASVYVSKRNQVTGDTENKNIAFLRKGKSFGELAIINSSNRNENVICHTNVSVLCIDRDDFMKIFMNKEEGKEPDHILFLREIDLLKYWPLDELPHDNAKLCLVTFFRKGVYMCKNSLKNDWIFVVKHGSCKVVKKISIPKTNLAFAKKPLNTPVNYFDFYSKNERYTSILRDEINNELNLQYNFDKIEIEESEDEENSVESFLKDEEKYAYIEIKKMIPKDMFGFVEMAYNLEEEKNRVMLISDGVECILINKKFFYKYLTPSLKYTLKKNVYPYPSELELQKKFQVQLSWNDYKKKLAKQKI